MAIEMKIRRRERKKESRKHRCVCVRSISMQDCIENNLFAWSFSVVINAKEKKMASTDSFATFNTLPLLIPLLDFAINSGILRCVRLSGCVSLWLLISRSLETTSMSWDIELDDQLLQDLYAWIDQIPLSRPKKRIEKDFADGGQSAFDVVALIAISMILASRSNGGWTGQILFSWLGTTGEKRSMRWQSFPICVGGLA